ncbi:hypothetical protein QFC22_005245 [Naganishia vaughanmartiniae]|uniref:Uncharacterized protein n=1 Tax=Naganishia vaughanmartiniae TaxID=1424756 RepID=A0ACC2WYC0_9TREE|nr:hypothetical protein QFC22_005245 [Naganishia vaughanmartiniae]
MSEAQKRAEARRAKILARGGAGLAKLASTARGEEAAALYDTNIPSRTTTPTVPAAKSPSIEDPAAEYQAQLERRMAALGGSSTGGPPAGAMDNSMKQFSEMMRKMHEDLGAPAGSPGTIGEGLSAVDPSDDPPTPPLPAVNLPDIPTRRGNKDPFALTAPSGQNNAMEGDMSSLFPGLNIPPEMLQMLQGAGGNNGGGGGTGTTTPGMGNPFAPPAPVKKTKLALALPFIHLASVVAFYLFTILYWEPSVWASGRRSALTGELPVERRERWVRLKGEVGTKSDLLDSGWASLPVFWAFVMLEVLLISTQTMFIPVGPPSLPSLLQNFLPLIPQTYSRPLLLAFKYAALAGQVATDAAVFVFLFGVSVVFAR